MSSQGGPMVNQNNMVITLWPMKKFINLNFMKVILLLESRFGQSIRFSGYNNDDNTFSPTIIIRNRESDPSREAQGEYQSQKIGGTTEEDLNRDGSIIVTMGSRDKQFDFSWYS